MQLMITFYLGVHRYYLALVTSFICHEVQLYYRADPDSKGLPYDKSLIVSSDIAL